MKFEEVYKQMISQTRLNVNDPDAHILTLTGTLIFKWVHGGDAAYFIMGDNQIPIHLQNCADEDLRPYENKIITVRCFFRYNHIIIKYIIDNEA